MRKLLAAIVVAMWGGLATAEEIVIAALGDSLTHGYGLPVEQGFVPQMQAWLRGQGALLRWLGPHQLAGLSMHGAAGTNPSLARERAQAWKCRRRPPVQ